MVNLSENPCHTPPLDPVTNICGVCDMKISLNFRVSQPTSFRSANRTARHGFGNSSGLVGMNLLA